MDIGAMLQGLNTKIAQAPILNNIFAALGDPTASAYKDMHTKLPNGETITWNQPSQPAAGPAQNPAAPTAAGADMASIAKALGGAANGENPRFEVPNGVNIGVGGQSIKSAQLPNINFGSMLRQRYGNA